MPATPAYNPQCPARWPFPRPASSETGGRHDRNPHFSSVGLPWSTSSTRECSSTQNPAAPIHGARVPPASLPVTPVSIPPHPFTPLQAAATRSSPCGTVRPRSESCTTARGDSTFAWLSSPRHRDIPALAAPAAGCAARPGAITCRMVASAHSRRKALQHDLKQSLTRHGDGVRRLGYSTRTTVHKYRMK